MEVALVRGAVAEERDRHAALALAPRAPAPVAAAMLPPTIPKQPTSPCSRSTTFIEPGAAAADAGRAAEHLGRERLGIGALGQRVAVAAVGAGDVVAGSSADADADRDRLLAGAQVRRAVDLALQEEPWISSSNRRISSIRP